MRTIQEYFERIETSMAAGELVLSARDPAQGDLAKAKCAEAASLIASYNLHVHRTVFEPLMESPDAVVRKRVCLVKAECIALTEDLRVAVKALTERETPLDFDALSGRVEMFNARVRRHMTAVAELLGAPATVRLAA